MSSERNSRGIKKTSKAPAVRLPKKLSKGEEALALQLKAYKIEFQREYPFAQPIKRKWRADFALGVRHWCILVEVEGGVGGKSRHTSGQGFKNDCEKYNTATALGWRVLRFTTEQVTSGMAINAIIDLLKAEDRL